MNILIIGVSAVLCCVVQLVMLVDRSVAVLDAAKKNKNKTPDVKSEGNSSVADPLVRAVDDVVALVGASGALFPNVVGPDATLATPVQYNGQTKRGRLEDLYVAYAKASMADLQALLQGGGDDSAAKLQQVP